MASGLSFEEIQKSYLKVFFALLVLTALTVAVTTVHFGDTANIVVGVVIALLKAGLVAYIFMHLKFDNRKLRYFITVPMFFFVTLVFTLTMLGL
ncbi:MAG: cytochrome C oxidase subunit IV family protein [Bacteroidota bacterium]|jgi:cytochrome c oxidase subunit 4|nr:cytochrome C oxidase subunit IV family protein [Bacteroidota bacterium]